MEIRDIISMYHVEGRDTVLTFDKYIVHPEWGVCRIRIHRKTGNDSGLKSKMTHEALKACEPNVGMWPGDRIEVFDVYGQLIDRKEG